MRRETEADLDALIAEQMRNLPAWWHDARERQIDKRRDAAIVRLRAQGVTVGELASRYNLARDRIYKILARPREVERQREKRQGVE